MTRNELELPQMKPAPIILGIAALLALPACGSDDAPAGASAEDEAAATTAAPTRVLVDAAITCGLSDSGVLGDDGASLTISTGGTETTSDESIEDLGCLLNDLEAPDYVISHIDSTRALDGMQEDEWGDLSARWTYHPEDGLNFTLVDAAAP